MTNWEKSCVEALVTSPSAFALFRAKQKNKKHVDQYINTIWPYKIKKFAENKLEEKRKRIEEGEEKLNPKSAIMKFFEDLLKQGEHGYVDKSYMFDKEYTAKEIARMINANRRCKEVPGSDVGAVHFHSSNRIETTIVVRVCGGGNYNFLKEIKKSFLRVGKEVKFSKMITDTNLTRSRTTDYITDMLGLMRLKGRKSKKIKRLYDGQNVGIEIEYEGTWHKYLEKKLNSSKYAVSFNSGIDGGQTDGSKYNSNSRLRENRLRINGSRGLNALHFLLEEMVKSRSKMTDRSGMHYHIDLRSVDLLIKERIDVVQEMWLLIDRYRIQEQLRLIFDVKSELIDLKSCMTRLMKFPTEFNTIEWRMGTPTFNFTKLAVQILCAIHITNALFKKKKNIDVEYLKYLAEIYNKINS